MASPAYKTIVSFVEVVVIVVQIAHGHHAFTVVFVYLAINSVAGNAADVRIILFAQLVGHELYHLILNGIAFRVLCNLFHFRRMLAQFFIVFLVRTAASCGITRKQTMHHRVGITAYRTGEMRVIIEGQAEVTYVMDAVFGLHHGAEGDGFDEVLLAFARHFVH